MRWFSKFPDILALFPWMAPIVSHLLDSNKLNHFISFYFTSKVDHMLPSNEHVQFIWKVNFGCKGRNKKFYVFNEPEKGGNRLSMNQDLLAYVEKLNVQKILVNKKSVFVYLFDNFFTLCLRFDQSGGRNLMLNHREENFFVIFQASKNLTGNLIDATDSRGVHFLRSLFKPWRVRSVSEFIACFLRD
jgi:hypothetical protein